MKNLQKYIVAFAWGIVGLTLIEHEPSIAPYADLNAFIEVVFDLFGILSIVKMWERLNDNSRS